MDKCPLCGSDNFGELDPANGADSFLIVGFSKSENKIVDSGLPVQIFACADCHNITIHNETINFVD